MAQNCGAEFRRPAQPLQFAHADEGMLFRRGVPLVVEVVEQRGGRVELDEAQRAPRPQAQAGRLPARRRPSRRLPPPCACLRRLSLSVHSVSKLPGLLAAELLLADVGLRSSQHSTCCTPWFAFLRVLLGSDPEILRVDPNFLLDNYGSLAESSTYRGAIMHPGSPRSGTPHIQPWQPLLVSVETREVVRCDYCSLVQYRTSNSLCRKCHRPLDIEEPVFLAPQLVSMPTVPASAEAGLQVAAQVREFAVRAT